MLLFPRTPPLTMYVFSKFNCIILDGAVVKEDDTTNIYTNKGLVSDRKIDILCIAKQHIVDTCYKNKL